MLYMCPHTYMYICIHDSGIARWCCCLSAVKKKKLYMCPHTYMYICIHDSGIARWCCCLSHMCRYKICSSSSALSASRSPVCAYIHTYIHIRYATYIHTYIHIRYAAAAAHYLPVALSCICVCCCMYVHTGDLWRMYTLYMCLLLLLTFYICYALLYMCRRSIWEIEGYMCRRSI
jgi:hypothetical protein